MRVHLIGIGGTGLSAIAVVLLESGVEVSGSDRQASSLTRRVQEAGGRVNIGHHADHVKGVDLVVRSSAIPDTNPEVVAARQAGIPVYKRIDFLRQLTAGRATIAVAGTHGKTTTTAMIAWMLTALRLDPSYIIGGIAVNLGRNAHAGLGPHFVIEADEYDRMFLGLDPYIAVITNIEHDHPDCYPTAADFYQAFREFAGKLIADGVVLACGDDPGAANLLVEEATLRKTRSYGLENPAFDYRAQDLFLNEHGAYTFLAKLAPSKEKRVMDDVVVALKVPGIHNVRNAVAALGVADLLGISIQKAARALSDYQGTSRRFEVHGGAGGVTVIDDYAHHPTEIAATLQATRARFPGRKIWAVWQPHTYSRTRQMLEKFASSFGDTSDIVDHILVTEIYPAREASPQDGFSSRQVVERMNHPDVLFVPDLATAREFLSGHLRSNDVLLVLSAGDADQLSGQVLTDLKVLQPLRQEFGERISTDAPLARLTAARVGGPADILFEVASSDELVKACQALWQSGASFMVLGGGSNILVSDAGVRGAVILNRARQIIFDEKSDTPTVWSESGANFGVVARQAARHSLAGLEWAAGIPGTVGGAVVGNAGAHGGDMAGNLLMAEILHRDRGIEKWPVEKMHYGYRESLLKRQRESYGEKDDQARNPDAVVLSATLQLRRGDPREIEVRMAEYAAFRRRTQPPGASMGSMFKNPPGDHAGRLIDAAGLKSVRIGDAQISPLHGNFFINLGNASAADVRSLIDLAQQTVFERFGVQLELEIELVGEW